MANTQESSDSVSFHNQRTPELEEWREVQEAKLGERLIIRHHRDSYITDACSLLEWILVLTNELQIVPTTHVVG